MFSSYHTSVLLQEVLEYLDVKKGGKYIDCTLGGGGHTDAILKKGGIVLGIDTDPDAIGFARRKFANELEATDSKLSVVQGNFEELGKIAVENDFDKVDGILFDLGVSGYQLDTPERGFSYKSDELLDMRMSPNLQVTAADLVNGLNQKELYLLFRKLGEEFHARAVSKNIVTARAERKIKTCRDLANIIYKSKANPAQVFQALRIAVNDELNNLRSALPQALELLLGGGRLVVISFHSLEDRIVKQQFRNWESNKLVKTLTKKVIMSSDTEVAENPRARSAKLRTIEKL